VSVDPVRFAGRAIGIDQPPFIVAELSGNHNGSLERARAIIDAAIDAGADAIKLQTYTADTLTIACDAPGFRISDPGSPWAGRTLYDLYREAHTPWDWHEALFEHCARRGTLCFSTPFDASAVEFLEGLHCPVYKIASFELVDLELIAAAAATGKPLVMSTGLASLEDIDDAVRAARGAGCRQLVLLKCTSSYPADPADSNLRTIPALRECFGCEVGLSDHTPGITAAIAAVALGASVIEKHVTLSRADRGVDAAFSLEPPELRQLKQESTQAWRALGAVSYGPSAAEEASRIFRRSLHVVVDLEPGDLLTRYNVRSIRPGHGLAPKHLGAVLGKAVTRAVPRGTPVTWDLIR
jgi:N-acetylneuraminate synthase